MTDKQHWFNVLTQTMQVPVNQAEPAAEVLAQESANPQHQRTPQEQEAISNAYSWWVAKGMPSQNQTTAANE